MNQKNILFLTVLCCAINIIAAQTFQAPIEKADPAASLTNDSASLDHTNPSFIVSEHQQVPEIARSSQSILDTTYERKTIQPQPSHSPTHTTCDVIATLVSPRQLPRSPITTSNRQTIASTKGMIPFNPSSEWEDTGTIPQADIEALEATDHTTANNPEASGLFSSLGRPVTWVAACWKQQVSETFLLEQCSARVGVTGHEEIFIRIIKNHEFKAFMKRLNEDKSRRGFRWFDLAISEAGTNRQDAINKQDWPKKRQHEENLVLFFTTANNTKLSDILPTSEILPTTEKVQNGTLLKSLSKDVLTKYATVIAVLRAQKINTLKLRVVATAADMVHLQSLECEMSEKQYQPPTAQEIHDEAQKIIESVKLLIESQPKNPQ